MYICTIRPLAIHCKAKSCMIFGKQTLKNTEFSKD